VSKRMYGDSMIEAFPSAMDGAGWVQEKAERVLFDLARAWVALRAAGHDPSVLRPAVINAAKLAGWVVDRPIHEVAFADVMAQDPAGALEMWADLTCSDCADRVAAMLRLYEARQ
jgi:hypothetical protein